MIRKEHGICTVYTWFNISAKEWIDSDNMVADPVYKYAPNLNSITAKLLKESKLQQISIYQDNSK